MRYTSFQEQVKWLCKAHLATPAPRDDKQRALGVPRTSALNSAVLGEEP